MLLSSMDFLQMAGAAFWDFTWKRTTEKMHILVKVEMIDGYNVEEEKESLTTWGRVVSLGWLLPALFSATTRNSYFVPGDIDT